MPWLDDNLGPPPPSVLTHFGNISFTYSCTFIHKIGWQDFALQSGMVKISFCHSVDIKLENFTLRFEQVSSRTTSPICQSPPMNGWSRILHFKGGLRVSLSLSLALWAAASSAVAIYICIASRLWWFMAFAMAKLTFV